MDRRLFLGWLKVNVVFFAGAFFAFLFLGLVFPDYMLGFVRGWGGF